MYFDVAKRTDVPETSRVRRGREMQWRDRQAPYPCEAQQAGLGEVTDLVGVPCGRREGTVPSGDERGVGRQEGSRL